MVVHLETGGLLAAVGVANVLPCPGRRGRGIHAGHHPSMAAAASLADRGDRAAHLGDGRHRQWQSVGLRINSSGEPPDTAPTC